MAFPVAATMLPPQWWKKTTASLLYCYVITVPQSTYSTEPFISAENNLQKIIYEPFQCPLTIFSPAFFMKITTPVLFLENLFYETNC